MRNYSLVTFAILGVLTLIAFACLHFVSFGVTEDNQYTAGMHCMYNEGVANVYRINKTTYFTCEDGRRGSGKTLDHPTKEVIDEN